MPSLTVTITAEIEGSPPVSRSESKPIPPEYGPLDIAQMFAVEVEDTADDMLAEAGFRQPRLLALRGNAARLTRLEQVLAVMPKSGAFLTHAQRLQDIIDTSAEDAIDKWGDGPLNED